MFVHPTKRFIITYLKLLVWKMFINFNLKDLSISFLIISCTAPIFFLKEFTFSAPIATFLAFGNPCAVTEGKTSSSALSSAELLSLNNLLSSTFGLTGLSVFFSFYPFSIADSSFSVLFLAPMQVSSSQAFIL